MKDRSDDPSHHERTLLPRSYISLPNITDVCLYGKDTYIGLTEYWCIVSHYIYIRLISDIYIFLRPVISVISVNSIYVIVRPIIKPCLFGPNTYTQMITDLSEDKTHFSYSQGYISTMLIITWVCMLRHSLLRLVLVYIYLAINKHIHAISYDYFQWVVSVASFVLYTTMSTD